MGFMDFMFGTSEDAKLVGNAPLMSNNQRQLFNDLVSMVAPHVGQGVDPYPGDMAAPASPLQSSAFEAIQQLLGGQGAPGVDALTQLLQPFSPTGTQEAWRTSVVNPAVDVWQDQILPTIHEKYIAQNAGSSGAMNRAITGSGEDLASSLAAQLGQMTYQAEQAHLGRQVPAADQLLRQLLGVAGAGEAQRSIAQDELTAQLQQWTQSQPYANPYLQLMMQLLGQQVISPIVQGPTSSEGFIGDLLEATSKLGAAAIKA